MYALRSAVLRPAGPLDPPPGEAKTEGAVAEQHAGPRSLQSEDPRKRLRADDEGPALWVPQRRKLSAVASAKTKPEHTVLQVEGDA